MPADKSPARTSGESSREELLRPREAALLLKISYPTIKQWIYHKKIKAVQTAGGHTAFPKVKSTAFSIGRAAATPTTDAPATAV